MYTAMYCVCSVAQQTSPVRTHGMRDMDTTGMTFHDRSVTAGDSSRPLTNSHAQCGVLGDSLLAVVYNISHWMGKIRR